MSTYSRPREGTRTPASFEDDLKASASIPVDLQPNLKNPLVKLDLKTDTLNDFLGDVSGMLNDHS